MQLENKKVTIIGAVRSGEAAALLLKKLGAIPFVSDMASQEKIEKAIETFRREGISFETGGHTDRVYDADIMIVSPGVPSDAPIVVEAKKRDIRVISEIELAWSLCNASVVAITGTNGKTTTTALMEHIFLCAGKAAKAAGNIGVPFSSLCLDTPADGVVALEVSSFQLDTIDSFKPSVSMILNITPDHLNRYENSFAQYAASKHRITMNQDATDLLILNADDPGLQQFPPTTRATVMQFSMEQKITDGAYTKNGFLICVRDGKEMFRFELAQATLRGPHNAMNMMAAAIAALWMGVTTESLTDALRSFPGVEHRIEDCGEKNGIRFINDSKATNVDSVWYALGSFDYPIYLILGGRDKGNDYGRIEEPVLKKVKKVYAIGESAEKVERYFTGKVPVSRKTDLKDCVESVLKEAEEGSVLLLSPACASFDMFDSYEHRGKVFKQAVSDMLQ